MGEWGCMWVRDKSTCPCHSKFTRTTPLLESELLATPTIDAAKQHCIRRLGSTNHLESHTLGLPYVGKGQRSFFRAIFSRSRTDDLLNSRRPARMQRWTVPHCSQSIHQNQLNGYIPLLQDKHIYQVADGIRDC